MQLIEHIEILISEYSCLSIPGFGGFVVQEVDAQFVDHVLMPPCVEVAFNRDLSHNDGLLISQIARINGSGTNEAASWIKDEVARYHKILLDFKRLDLGRLGYLTMNEEGGVVFIYNKENLLFPKFLGMRPVSLALIRKNTTLEESSFGMLSQEPALVLDFPNVRKSSYLKYAITAAAAVLLFFVSTPSLYDSRKPQTASMFFDSFKFVSDTQEHLIDRVIETDSPYIDTTDLPAKETLQSLTHFEFTENGRYCVVVLSCSSQKSANLEIAKREGLLDSAQIIEGNGRFRVVVMQTNNRSKANDCLNYYKKKGLADTWIHVTR